MARIINVFGYNHAFIYEGVRMRMKSLCLIAFGTLALGCGNAQNAQMAQKQQIIAKWTLHALMDSGNKINVNAREKSAFVEFRNEEFSGNAGCNNFFGNYQLEGNQLKTNGAGMTRMMCAPESMAIEDALSKLFAENGSSIQLEGNTLILQKDSTRAIFTK